MKTVIRQIKQRMSLRKPQSEALEILAKATDQLSLIKRCKLEQELQKVREFLPDCLEFEREFPNLCFALATGVGKTRLVGAMITYLVQTKGVRHFFILAPNNTILEKLVREFSNPNDPK